MLRVVTREEPPYVMRCDNCSSTSQLLHNHSSQGYQGFAIDLLDAISQVSAQSQLLDSVPIPVQVAGFQYSLYLVPDNLYGVYDHETREWNGIVRETRPFAQHAGTLYYLYNTLATFRNNCPPSSLRNGSSCEQRIDRQEGRHRGGSDDHQLCQVLVY